MKKPLPTSRAAANNQAKRIRRYWRKQGYDVSLSVSITAYDRSKHPIWGVRSDMLDGIPVRRVQ